MEEIKFTAWPKTPRLFKESMIVTEKLDGTNAAIGVVELTDAKPGDVFSNAAVTWDAEGDRVYLVYAQSRNRIITPQSVGGKGSDNYDFANWVWSNSESLLRVLGPGLHFGEWRRAGIARNYGQTSRYFSLFNTSRWGWLDRPEARLEHGVPRELRAVPVISVNTLDTGVVRGNLQYLKENGSLAAPGFMNPEGICVFLPSVGRTLKVTYEGDQPKYLLDANLKAA